MVINHLICLTIIQNDFGFEKNLQGLNSLFLPIIIMVLK